MAAKSWGVQGGMLLVGALFLSAIPALAGSGVVGSVAGSMNATLGGEALRPNTTLFSGDKVEVKDGAAVVAVGKGSRMVMGRETVAAFEREGAGVAVLLERGSVSVYQPKDGVALSVKIGGVKVEAAGGTGTLADVARLNGTVVVTAQQGTLEVAGAARAVQVKAGQTITLTSKVQRSPNAAQGQGGASSAGQPIEGMPTSEILTIATVGVGAGALVVALMASSAANDAKTQTCKVGAALSPAVPCT